MGSLDGTGLAAAHIGDAAALRLKQLLGLDGETADLPVQLGAASLARLRALIELPGASPQTLYGTGGVQCSEMPISNQPTAGDTFTIGADVYEWRASGGSLSNDARIAVEISAVNAAGSLANAVAAINAADSGNEHATIFKSDGETPAKSCGTEPYKADAIGTSLRIRSASAAGGTVQGSTHSALLAENMTHATSVWKTGNVNMDTLGGRAASHHAGGCVSKSINAGMVTAGFVRFAFPFTVGAFIVQVRTAAGLLRGPMATDAASIDNGDVKITITSSDASDIDVTDVVTVIAFP